MTRNLQLIWVHTALARASTWIPIMVLLTRSEFGLERAIELSSFYYLFVVAFEVPSGWLSDRFGRALTLRLVGLAWIGAHTCFAFGGDVYGLYIVGNALLALGYASLSGTDVSFHFDSLEALGRADEFEARESRVSAVGYIASGVAAVGGGALGFVDLRLPFVVAAVLALAQFGVAARFAEPPATGLSVEAGVLRHAGTVMRSLRTPMLSWLFLYGVAMVVLEHVAFTPLQPWLTEALGETATAVGSTPLLSGIVVAGVSVVGAAAARSADALGRYLGVVVALIGLGVVSALIITTMTVSTSLVVLAAIAFRSAQGAAAPILLSGAMAKRTPQHQRATLLSLNSLGGRLAYGLVLRTVANDIDDDLQPALEALTIISWVLVGVLVLTAGALSASRRGSG